MKKLSFTLFVIAVAAIPLSAFAKSACTRVIDEAKFTSMGGKITIAYQPPINSSFCSGADCKAHIELEGTIYPDGHVDDIVVVKNTFHQGPTAWARSAKSYYRYTKFVPPELGSAPVCVRHSYVFSLN